MQVRHLTKADMSDLKLVVINGLLQAAIKQLDCSTQCTLHINTTHK